MNCALVWCNAEYYLFHLQSFIVCGFFSHKKISVNFRFPLLAPQSGALRISAYGDFQSHPNPTQPIHPLIAFEHLSLSIVIWDSAYRPRQINVEQVRPKQVSTLQNFTTFKKFQNFQHFQIF